MCKSRQIVHVLKERRYADNSSIQAYADINCTININQMNTLHLPFGKVLIEGRWIFNFFKLSHEPIEDYFFHNCLNYFPILLGNFILQIGSFYNILRCCSKYSTHNISFNSYSKIAEWCCRSMPGPLFLQQPWKSRQSIIIIFIYLTWGSEG